MTYFTKTISRLIASERREAGRISGAVQGREALAAAATALEMSPKERAMYLRRRMGPEPLGGPEEEASTLAGPTPGALRTWLRQVRHQACVRLTGLEHRP